MHAKNFGAAFTILTTLTLFLAGATNANAALKLTSPAFADGDPFPVQFTCEAQGISPPLNWTEVPKNTQSLVVILDHMPHHPPQPNLASKEEQMPPPVAKSTRPEGLRWYWSMYNIGLNVSAVLSGQSVGTLGSNVVNNNNAYSPPCSKGPGQKDYTFHLYALSTSLDMTTSDHVSPATLRKSMKGLILDSASLTVSFARSCQRSARPRPQQGRQQQEQSDPLSVLPKCTYVMGTQAPAMSTNQ
jgi:phosphatidylethanolamine-binding protein (PEBP) family uncharacterized protein